MEHKKWVILCLIGGILMVLSSLVGSLGFIGTLISLISGILGPEYEQLFSTLVTILTYIAAGGGFSVIVGALIAGYGPDRLGRIVVGLGIGTSLIGLIILLITTLIGGTSIGDLPSVLFSAFNGTYGLLGVILSIFSRKRLKD